MEIKHKYTRGKKKKKEKVYLINCNKIKLNACVYNRKTHTHTHTLMCMHTCYKNRGTIKVKVQVIMKFLKIYNKFHMYTPSKMTLIQMKKNW